MSSLTVKEEMYLLDLENEPVDENEITVNEALMNVYENFLGAIEQKFQHDILPNYIYANSETDLYSMKHMKSVLKNGNIEEIRKVLHQFIKPYSPQVKFLHNLNKADRRVNASVSFSHDDEVQESLGIVFYILFG